ncbi:hypothetical protein HYALB_00009116 [Hymenoscyphus albidus]|uniref:Asp/Glu/hydantoin racemase n=1 Tax=Hymenoscyphus albidus TaxID=595503 RepID=A0A9N9LIB0_9HELO|nr:hypothetical protein HYALB_00009116 [Hymenoscyphus albidus]
MIKRVLVFNPNTNKAITETFIPILASLNLPNTVFTYWTASTGPSLIRNQADMFESASHCIPSLFDIAHNFHGFLGACYADHPIVRLFQSYVSDKPVVSIFDASIHAALQMIPPDSKFGIITTGMPFEEILAEGVKQLFSNTSAYTIEHLQKFGGVVASHIGEGDLDNDTEGTAREKIMAATTRLLESGQVNVLCLGGVILVGMESWIREACDLALGPQRGREVMIIDQLAAGALMLDACLQRKAFIDFNPALR